MFRLLFYFHLLLVAVVGEGGGLAERRWGEDTRCDETKFAKSKMKKKERNRNSVWRLSQTPSVM